MNAMRHGLTFLVAAALLACPGAARAKGYTLPELLDMARAGYPSIAASRAATSSMEAQLTEARWSRGPSGDLLAIVAPSPSIRCLDDNCTETNVTEATLNFKGILTRNEVRLIQPVYTFGKISAGVAAATAGVSAARAKESIARADVEANVRKAYYAAKLAREIVATLDEGRGYLDDAEKTIQKELDEGKGTATVTDKLRLRTVRAEVEARYLEAKRLGDVARGALRVLVGPEPPAELDVDDDPLEAVEVPARPLSHYLDQARLYRPEARALESAMAAKRALADLERRRLYPDLVLMGQAVYAYSNSVDNPKNAFLNHTYNSATAGVVAALRMPLDFGPRGARSDRAAADALEIDYRRREALGAIALEVEKAHLELAEAQERATAVKKGEKAGKAWITAVAQNLEVGLAEARDFADALSAFFQMRVRYLQALYDVDIAAAAMARATGAEVVAATASPAASP